MSFLVASPNHRNDDPPEDGQVDRLLRAFYRAEMPNPWPSFATPADAPTLLSFPTPTARRPLSWRSRLALAASVALLVTGMGILSGKFSSSTGDDPSHNRIIDEGATRLSPGSNQPLYMTAPAIDHDMITIRGFIEEPPTGPGR